VPTFLVTGANRGLGLEFVRQYAADGWTVIACCRTPDAAPELKTLADNADGRIAIEALDVRDNGAIEACAERQKHASIDVLLNNAGIIGPRGGTGQSFSDMDYDAWSDVLRTNAMAPMKMCQSFVEQVARSEQKKIASISSTIGSNSETHGRAYTYASSKAALNMVMTTMAKDMAGLGIAVGVYCPGHVKTDMGEADADVEIPDSIAGVRQRIAELTLARTGTFHRYNGDAIAW
jgi:NAD(P)-dependent dehydrogenase (short-subunit alcohol dehydrogenase family)